MELCWQQYVRVESKRFEKSAGKKSRNNFSYLSGDSNLLLVWFLASFFLAHGLKYPHHKLSTPSKPSPLHTHTREFLHYLEDYIINSHIFVLFNQRWLRMKGRKKMTMGKRIRNWYIVFCRWAFKSWTHCRHAREAAQRLEGENGLMSSPQSMPGQPTAPSLPGFWDTLPYPTKRH